MVFRHFWDCIKEKPAISRDESYNVARRVGVSSPLHSQPSLTRREPSSITVSSFDAELCCAASEEMSRPRNVSFRASHL